MKPLTRLFLTGAVVAICAGTAWAAEEGTVKMFAPWQSGGQVFRIGPDKLLFQGRAEGIMYIEDGEGALDAALFVCPGSREISLSEKKVIASGRCIIKGSGGGTVFAKFECSGEPGDIIVRTVLGEMASDLQSGETISGSAGLAIWPSLSYKIPGN
jgi:hypothetical protein